MNHNRMKIYAEIYPYSKKDSLLDEIESISQFDGIDIPDNPLGYPTMSPEVIAYIIKNYYDNKDIIINQRLKDINELKLRSLIKTAKFLGVSMAFTLGDDPKYGISVNDVDSLKAFEIAHKRHLRAGLILSLRKPESLIRERLKTRADFFLGTNFDGLTFYNDERIIPYIIIETEKNRNIIRSMRQHSFNLNEVYDLFYTLDYSAVLLSCPGDFESLSFIINRL
ncbi:hypothetical protein PTO0883 [Picrophilus oshimae DSM 9789]|uniref:Methylenetetrahydrofolate reductase (NAD(P)H) n=2 Tax=Picrophilus oshimae TaxID=46632 RepID=Q6L0N4_PICTO|nr:hypothetical protein PTO0883 [Picrophilus oshimae DSM 9789]